MHIQQSDRDRLISYTSASILPAKVLQNQNILDWHNRIRPIHIQLNPTNRCMLNCEYCSCSNRDKTAELPIADVREMLYMFAGLGAQSVTITGGGEPLLHPAINDMIDICKSLGILVGLVSNAIAIKDLQTTNVDWARISFADDRDASDEFFHNLSHTVVSMPHIAWAFSYVIGRSPDFDKLKLILSFADTHKFTHVRLVSDLLDLSHVPQMMDIKAALTDMPGEHLVIYQGRKKFTVGTKRCLISLLKPLVSATGHLFPCCGAQYAIENPARDYESALQMGHWRDFSEIFAQQQHFDGSICAKCYYQDYNTVLDLITAPLQHREFV